VATSAFGAAPLQQGIALQAPTEFTKNDLAHNFEDSSYELLWKKYAIRIVLEF
jgi:hypothetical protein